MHKEDLWDKVKRQQVWVLVSKTQLRVLECNHSRLEPTEVSFSNSLKHSQQVSLVDNRKAWLQHQAVFLVSKPAQVSLGNHLNRMAFSANLELEEVLANSLKALVQPQDSV